MIKKLFITIIIIGVVIIKIAHPISQDPSKDTLIKFFNKNKIVFSNVASELKSIENEVSIDKRDGHDIDSIGKINTKEGVKLYVIPDNIKSDAKKIIYEYGFMDIYEEDNCIYFDKAVDFHWHKALVYSKDGKTPPQIKVQEFEELGDGWYYYVGE